VGGVSYEFASSYSLPPHHFITFIVPEFFGSPINKTYWGSSNFWELCGYVGILPLILGLIGIIFKKNRYTLTFTALVLFTLLFSLGRYTPFFSIFYYYIPGFNMFRIPATFLYVYAFSVSILAGFGSNFLINAISDKDTLKFNKFVKLLIIIGILSIAITIFVYLGESSIISLGKSMVAERYALAPAPPHHPLSYYYNLVNEIYSSILKSIIISTCIFIISIVIITIRAKEKIKLKHLKVLLVLLILFDLWIFGMGYLDTKNPNDVFETPELVNIIKNDKSLYRVFDMSNSIGQEITSKNGIESITGYDPSYLRYYQDFLWLVGNHSRSKYSTSIHIYEVTNHNILYLLNTKYIFTDKRLDATWCEEIYNKNGTIIYRINNTMPRAFIVRNAKIIKEKEDVFSALENKELKPEEQIILEKDPNVPLNNPGKFKAVKITHYTPNRINLQINLSDPGFLVLSEIWYPGWRAYDNGQEMEIYKTNYVLRSIYLKRGGHNVSFIYDPASYKFGRTISLASFIFMSLILMYNLKRRVEHG